MTAISEIQIVPVKHRDGLVAFASFLINNEIYCGSVAIFTLPFSDGDEYRLVYPTKRVGNKEFNIFHPVNREVGTYIEKEVIKKYEEVIQYDWRRYNNPEFLST